MTDTNVTTNSEQKKWPVWLVASLGFVTIICGIITICAPSVFWKFLDIILGISLIFSGISAIIKWFTDKEKYLWLLIILSSLVILLWFLLVFSWSKFIWTLTIWAFAIWALLRWFILIYFSLTNREQQKFWRGILALWILLIILFFIIAFSDKSEARSLAWICIGISTVFDWIFLLILSFRVNDDPSLQSQVLEQANQNEIAQPVVATPDAQPEASQQSDKEVKPWDIQEPAQEDPKVQW